MYGIIFPHLGIYLPEFPGSFRIFGFEIAFYGVLIAAAIVLAVILSVRRARATGQNPGDYLDLAIIGVISAIIGARLYYVLFSSKRIISNISRPSEVPTAVFGVGVT